MEVPTNAWTPTGTFPDSTGAGADQVGGSDWRVHEEHSRIVPHDEDRETEGADRGHDRSAQV